IAYVPTLNFGFIFDDAPTIVDNFYLKLHSYGALFFAHSRWVSMIMNAFTYHTWGLKPSAFRIFNLGMHIFNAFLLFVIFKTVLAGLKRSNFIQKRAGLISILAAGLFLLHPVQTQTATYITQMRLEGLATCFILSIIGLFILAIKMKKPGPKMVCYGGAVVLAIVSAGTKEIVVMLPALLLLVDVFFISQWRWKELLNRLPFHALLAVALYGAFYRFSFSSTVPFSLSSIVSLDAALECNRGNLLTEAPQVKITALRYLISEFKVLLHYITIFFWPRGLSFDYDYRMAESFWQFDVVAPLAGLIAIVFAAIFSWWRNKSSLVAFSIFWFLLSVWPRASIVPSAEMANDYKTYLGSVGMALLLAYLVVCAVTWIAALLRENGWRWSDRTYQSVFGVLLLFSSYKATVARNDVWSSDLKFWGDVIRKAPNKSRAYNNYAVALAVKGASEESLEYYKKSAELDSFYAEPLINLGSHYQMKKEYETALYYYGKALCLKHEPHPECYNNVGLIQYHYKNYDKAESCFKTAILLKGHYGKAYYNLAKVCYDKNDTQKAFENASMALKCDFVRPHVHLLHGKCAVTLGKYREGIKSLEQALSSRSDFNGIFSLAVAYYNERDYQKACAQFERAYKQQPDNLSCAYNYAQALMNHGRFVEAIPLFEQTAAESGRFPFAQLHISKCLSKNGNSSAALSRIEKVMKEPRILAHVKNDAKLLQEEILLEARMA
ncbi:tetratricopeptide repeat protein, partial [Candidatus Babeliales bacterium]|nr:tetratricopeptide repeat protein [Candidatus Babeliales bacterium]